MMIPCRHQAARPKYCYFSTTSSSLLSSITLPRRRSNNRHIVVTSGDVSSVYAIDSYRSALLFHNYDIQRVGNTNRCGFYRHHSTSFSTSAVDNKKNISSSSALYDNGRNNNDNNNSPPAGDNDTTTLSSSSSTLHTKNNYTTLLSNLTELSKARLSALVVSTTAFGFLAAGPTALAYTSLPTFMAASLGTALCASSAATFNQIIEVEKDRQMKRTANRPLVTGAISRSVALGVGCVTGTAGGIVLGCGTDPLTTILGVGNIGLYAGVYTYLKPRLEINTWVGALVGAIPPVMGWTAAGGSIMDAEAILLGSTLFLWQFPHFFALNWMYRTDYKRGGFAMVAVNDPAGDRTASLIKRYGLYLTCVPFISSALEVTSPMFAIDAGIVLNGYAIYVASRFEKERSNANARKVFLTSLWYLPCVMMLFLLHSRRWHEDVTTTTAEIKLQQLQGLEDEDNNISVLVTMQKLMNYIQSKGRELCMHEAIVSKDVEVWVGNESNTTAIDGSKCPISLGKAVQQSTDQTIHQAANASSSIDVGVGATSEIKVKQETEREE